MGKQTVVMTPQPKRPKNMVLMTDITRGDASERARQERRKAHADKLLDIEKLDLAGPIDKFEVK